MNNYNLENVLQGIFNLKSNEYKLPSKNFIRIFIDNSQVRKNKEKKISKNFAFNNLRDLLSFTDAHINNQELYFTPNTLFSRSKFKDKNTKNYNVLMLDLDTEKLGSKSPRKMFVYLKKNWNNLFSDLFFPSIVVNSGHGLHLLWLIKPLINNNQKISFIWKTTEHKLINFVSNSLDCVDSSVSSPAHLLRIPTSINYKNHSKIKSEILFYNPNSRHELRDFFPIFQKDKKHSKNLLLTKSINYKSELIKGLSKFRRQLKLRKEDLEILVNFRNKISSKKNIGFRELTAFIYFNTCWALFGRKKAFNLTLNLNKKLGLAEDEIIHLLKSNTLYSFSTSNIIKILNISETEFHQLKILHPQNFSKNNLRKQIKINREKKRRNLAFRLLKSYYLKHEKIAKICRKFCVSRQTMYNWLKKYTLEFLKFLKEKVIKNLEEVPKKFDFIKFINFQIKKIKNNFTNFSKIKDKFLLTG